MIKTWQLHSVFLKNKLILFLAELNEKIDAAHISVNMNLQPAAD